MVLVIIGSKGFIGSHCKAYFESAGHEVINCDIQEIVEKNYYSIGQLNNDYSALFKTKPVDFCINAAGSANVAYSYQFPEKDFELNVSLVINLLGAIKNFSPACKFINFSSAAVYGNPSQLPIKENSELKPLSPYGYHKMLSEKLLTEYHHFFNLKTCSLRVFSAYGPGLKKQLFWDVFQKSKKSKVIQLYGTGMESRDFISITDLITAVDLIMKYGSFCGEAVNIASGKETFIKNAVETFIKAYDKGIQIEFSNEQKEGDPVNWCADISYLKTLGFKPNPELFPGLKDYSDWLNTNVAEQKENNKFF